MKKGEQIVKSKKKLIKKVLKLKEENLITSKNDLDEIVIDKNISIFYDGTSNREKDLENLIKEKERLENSIARREKLLSNENYVSKAPQNIVEQEKNNLKQEKENLETILNKLK